MKIFIAGARALSRFDAAVCHKLQSIYEKGYDVLVGDATGVDSAVQHFYAEKNYKNVTVFASNGIARNNIGHWDIENVAVEGKLRGFEFYKQKDIAMANAADFGFMIWNGESRGTLNNIINLIEQKKTCCVYLSTKRKFYTIDSNEKLMQLLAVSPQDAVSVYRKLTEVKTVQFAQLAMF